jgi:hypothetical protein
VGALVWGGVMSRFGICHLMFRGVGQARKTYMMIIYTDLHWKSSKDKDALFL